MNGSAEHLAAQEVSIVYRSLPHYRVDFYERLRDRLAQDNIHLRLIVGQPVGADAKKDDLGSVGWSEAVRNRVVSIRGRMLVWQPVLRRLRSSDLVIVEQANKLIVNPFLMIWRRLGGPKLALWGHGYDHDTARVLHLSERVKRSLLRQSDWFFAYTSGTAAYVVAAGVDVERVTVVQNAIDTRKLASSRRRLRRDAETHSEGRTSEHVAFFAGSLYSAKRLEFLIEAGDRLSERFADFVLLVVGDGPQRSVVEAAAISRPWLRYLGVATGDELVRATVEADLLLMPGLVGLVVLDAFALQTPLVTTAVDFHSPEIEYLVDGENGVVVDDWRSVSAYVDAVAGLWSDKDRLMRLREGCRLAAERYTVEAMVENFATGVTRCLAGR
jgi:glycosyltransferase involved in cell wall biosynthesis